MDKTKLFVDFDGVLINTMKYYCKVYNFLYQYHKDFKHADWRQVREWNFSDMCPLAKDNVNEIFESYLLFKFAEPFSDAVETLKQLKEKYQVIVVTIGTQKNISHKALWIEDNLPFISNAIYLYQGSSCKMDKSIVDMSGGILIDDHQNNLFSSNADMKICYSHESEVLDWNKDWKGLRVGGWEEVGRLLL